MQYKRVINRLQRKRASLHVRYCWQGPLSARIQAKIPSITKSCRPQMLVNARRNQKVKLCHGWMDDGTCNYRRRYVVNQTSKASN